MALQIVKNPADMPKLELTYRRYATVSLIRRTGLGKMFGPRGGSVYASAYCNQVYHVVAPKWKGGRNDEWEELRQCYRRVLQMAEKASCDAVTLPLLAGEEPGFPASIDYKIAVDTIREFLKTNNLTVFLQVPSSEADRMPELQQDLERFLASNVLDDMPQWSAHPYGADEDRFTTVTEPMMSGQSTWYDMPMASAESVSDEENWEPAEEIWEEEDEEEVPKPRMSAGPGIRGGFPRRKARPVIQDGYSGRKARPVIQDGCSGKKASVSRRDTGSLPDFLGPIELDAGFSETLLNLIDKTGKKDSEIYNKANVSRQHFSKIRNNPDYRPTKATAVAFAIALELNMEQTEDLIGRAGYRLTRSSKFDVIIMYFIEKRNYNMFAINEVLYEYDQSLLGA